jgi:hypothetical protein
LGLDAAAISHHATSNVPKYRLAPVARWTTDIVIVSVGL